MCSHFFEVKTITWFVQIEKKSYTLEIVSVYNFFHKTNRLKKEYQACATLPRFHLWTFTRKKTGNLCIGKVWRSCNRSCFGTWFEKDTIKIQKRNQSTSIFGVWQIENFRSKYQNPSISTHIYIYMSYYQISTKTSERERDFYHFHRDSLDDSPCFIGGEEFPTANGPNDETRRCPNGKPPS